MAEQTIGLERLAGGAVAERYAIELQKILDNIMDPNTSATKKRKLQLNLTFEPDGERDIVQVSVEAKVTLAPHATIATKILMDRDSDGHAVGAEFQQTRLFEESDVQRGPREVGRPSLVK